MKNCELVELAALAAAHGPVLIASGGRLSVSALEQYWASSKCRLDRWSRALRQFQTTGQEHGGSSPTDWTDLSGCLEEILTSELLTRVWSAVLAGYDRQHGTNEAEPVARSILMGHLEARHRTLVLLVSGQGVATEAAVAMNRLRHRVERWTDLLLAHLEVHFSVSDFCFDTDRLRDFAEGVARQSRQAAGRQAWALTMTALRSAFRSGLATSPNQDLNERIGSAVMACFPPEMFDGTGVVRSLWEVRLTNATSDVQGMIADLLQPEAAEFGRAAVEADSRWPNEFRRRFAR